jgi:hypothetical protein
VCSWSVRTWRLIVTGMNCLVSLLVMVIDSDRICSGVSLAFGMNIIPSKAQSEKMLVSHSRVKCPYLSGKYPFDSANSFHHCCVFDGSPCRAQSKACPCDTGSTSWNRYPSLLGHIILSKNVFGI